MLIEPSEGPDGISLPDHKSVVCVGRLNKSEDRSSCGDDIFLNANSGDGPNISPASTWQWTTLIGFGA